jgi:hypothetical protein
MLISPWIFLSLVCVHVRCSDGLPRHTSVEVTPPPRFLSFFVVRKVEELNFFGVLEKPFTDIAHTEPRPPATSTVQRRLDRGR